MSSIRKTKKVLKNSRGFCTVKRTHTYHRENCDCFIREVIIDVYGRRIILGGQHAFEYSITVISITGRIVVTNFKNGKEARKEFYKYKRKK